MAKLCLVETLAKQLNKNVLGEIISALHGWLYGVVMSYHCPNLDLQNILLATVGLVA